MTVSYRFGPCACCGGGTPTRRVIARHIHYGYPALNDSDSARRWSTKTVTVNRHETLNPTTHRYDVTYTHVSVYAVNRFTGVETLVSGSGDGFSAGEISTFGQPVTIGETLETVGDVPDSWYVDHVAVHYSTGTIELSNEYTPAIMHADLQALLDTVPFNDTRFAGKTDETLTPSAVKQKTIGIYYDASGVATLDIDEIPHFGDGVFIAQDSSFWFREPFYSGPPHPTTVFANAWWNLAKCQIHYTGPYAKRTSPMNLDGTEVGFTCSNQTATGLIVYDPPPNSATMIKIRTYPGDAC